MPNLSAVSVLMATSRTPSSVWYSIGMLAGSAVELYRQLMERFPQVIFTSSGGIGSLADVEEVAAAGVPRVIVGKALYEGRVTLEQLRPFAGDAV